MIKERIPEEHRRFYWLSSRAILLILFISLAYSILLYFTDLGIRERLTATGIISNVALTFALIAVYRDMSKLQDRQGDLMKLERLPEIDISNRSFDLDDVYVVLSNYGHGLGKDLRLVTAFDVPGNEEIEPLLTDTRLHRLTEGNRETLEQSIRPQEQQIEFRGRPSVALVRDGQEISFSGFSEALSTIVRNEDDSVLFQVWVVADDQTGSCQAKKLCWPARLVENLPEAADDPQDIRLETAYNHGGTVPRDTKRNLPSPDCRGSKEPENVLTDGGNQANEWKHKLMNVRSAPKRGVQSDRDEI